MSIIRILVSIIYLTLLLGCSSKSKEIKYTSIFGDLYFCSGSFDKDLKEVGNWRFLKNHNKLISFGEFDHGIKQNDWHYVFGKDSAFETFWVEYKNVPLDIKTNLPFPVIDTIIDQRVLRMRTNNDSLGFVSFLVQVNNPSIQNTPFDSLYTLSNWEIKGKAFEFKYSTFKLENADGKYLITEYHAIDRENAPAKIYTLIGYSKKFDYFVEISMLHQGANVQLVKEIFESVISNFYWNSKRFYNPYLNTSLIFIAQGS